MPKSELFELFQCNDIDVLLAKLDAVAVHRYVSGWHQTRFVCVSDYDLPMEMRARAIEIAEPSSGWHAFFTFAATTATVTDPFTHVSRLPFRVSDL